MPPSFQRHFRLSLLLLLFLLAACTRAEGELSTDTPTETSPALVSTATIPATSTHPTVPTRKPTLTASPTRTRMPSITPGPTMTPFPTRTATLIPTFTSTFDPYSTRIPPVQCPTENPNLALDFGVPANEFAYLAEPMLEFLNLGGTQQAVITAYKLRDTQADERFIRQADVTGDGVPELLFTEPGTLNVFYCENGKYLLQTPLTETYHFNIPVITYVMDLNMDGVNELVIFSGDDRFRDIDIFEWDIISFRYLMDEGRICSSLMGPSTFKFSDNDSNGIKELILLQTIPIWTEYTDGLPWREETRTCTWDGNHYTPTKIDYSPPEYRFQAVQDGDRAMNVGDFDKALDLYQQAIFNVDLDWWSLDRKIYEIQIAQGETTFPTPVPDTNEYYFLAAYARFRIMLIHLMRGHQSDAEVVFNTLQEKFPTGQPGYEFAEMAVQFWNEYQISSDMGLSCSAAIQYAANHTDILTYLGGDYHGDQSLSYEPPDICPFTSTPEIP